MKNLSITLFYPSSLFSLCRITDDEIETLSIRIKILSLVRSPFPYSVNFYELSETVEIVAILKCFQLILLDPIIQMIVREPLWCQRPEFKALKLTTMSSLHLRTSFSSSVKWYSSVRLFSKSLLTPKVSFPWGCLLQVAFALSINNFSVLILWLLY